eukprot:g178.t1
MMPTGNNYDYDYDYKCGRKEEDVATSTDYNCDGCISPKWTGWQEIGDNSILHGTARHGTENLARHEVDCGDAHVLTSFRVRNRKAEARSRSLGLNTKVVVNSIEYSSIEYKCLNVEKANAVIERRRAEKRAADEEAAKQAKREWEKQCRENIPDCGGGTWIEDYDQDPKVCECYCDEPRTKMTGTHCSIPAIACQNHGVVKITNNVASCDCPTDSAGRPVATGKHCEFCSIQCDHGGVPDLNMCTCRCPPQWGGAHCNRCRLKTDADCQNGGKLNADACSCTCSPGWHGADCGVPQCFNGYQVGHRYNYRTRVNAVNVNEMAGGEDDDNAQEGLAFETTVRLTVVGARHGKFYFRMQLFGSQVLKPHTEANVGHGLLLGKAPEAAAAAPASSAADAGNTAAGTTAGPDSTPPSAQIRAKHGVCLDAPGGSTKGTRVLMYRCDRTRSSQQWVYNEPLKRIKMRHGLCLALSPEHNAQLDTCDESKPAQQWAHDGATEQIVAGGDASNLSGKKCLRSADFDMNGGLVTADASCGAAGATVESGKAWVIEPIPRHLASNSVAHRNAYRNWDSNWNGAASVELPSQVSRVIQESQSFSFEIWVRLGTSSLGSAVQPILSQDLRTQREKLQRYKDEVSSKKANATSNKESMTAAVESITTQKSQIHDDAMKDKEHQEEATRKLKEAKEHDVANHCALPLSGYRTVLECGWVKAVKVYEGEMANNFSTFKADKAQWETAHTTWLDKNEEYPGKLIEYNIKATEYEEKRGTYNNASASIQSCRIGDPDGDSASCGWAGDADNWLGCGDAGGDGTKCDAKKGDLVRFGSRASGEFVLIGPLPRDAPDLECKNGTSFGVPAGWPLSPLKQCFPGYKCIESECKSNIDFREESGSCIPKSLIGHQGSALNVATLRAEATFPEKPAAVTIETRAATANGHLKFWTDDDTKPNGMPFEEWTKLLQSFSHFNQPGTAVVYRDKGKTATTNLEDGKVYYVFKKDREMANTFAGKWIKYRSLEESLKLRKTAANETQKEIDGWNKEIEEIDKSLQNLADSGSTGMEKSLRLLVKQDKHIEVSMMGKALASRDTVSPGEWTYVTVVYDHGLQRLDLFQNGALSSTTAEVPPLEARFAKHHLVLGVYESHRFHGAVAFPRLWSRPLQASKVRLNMQAMLSGTERGLAGAWQHNIMNPHVMEDTSPYKRDAKVVGTYDWENEPSLAHVVGLKFEDYKTNQAFHQALIKPFYFRQSCSMTVDHTYAPISEAESTIDIKKGITALFSQTVHVPSEPATRPAIFYQIAETGIHGAAVPMSYFQEAGKLAESGNNAGLEAKAASSVEKEAQMPDPDALHESFLQLGEGAGTYAVASAAVFDSSRAFHAHLEAQHGTEFRRHESLVVGARAHAGRKASRGVAVKHAKNIDAAFMEVVAMHQADASNETHRAEVSDWKAGGSQRMRGHTELLHLLNMHKNSAVDRVKKFLHAAKPEAVHATGDQRAAAQAVFGSLIRALAHHGTPFAQEALSEVSQLAGRRDADKRSMASSALAQQRMATLQQSTLRSPQQGDGHDSASGRQSNSAAGSLNMAAILLEEQSERASSLKSSFSTVVDTILAGARDLLIDHPVVKQFFDGASDAINRAIPDPALIQPWAASLVNPEEVSFVDLGASTGASSAATSAAGGASNDDNGHGSEKALKIEDLIAQLLRLPQEMVAAFEEIAKFDFMRCVPTSAVETVEFVDNVQARLSSIADDQPGARDAAKALRMVTAAADAVQGAVSDANARLQKVLDEVLGMREEMQEAISVLRELRSIVVELPKTVHDEIIKDNPSIESLGDTLKEQFLNVVDQAKTLVRKVLARIGAAFGVDGNTLRRLRDSASQLAERVESAGENVAEAASDPVQRARAARASQAMLQAAFSVAFAKCGLPQNVLDKLTLLMKLYDVVKFFTKKGTTKKGIKDAVLSSPYVATFFDAVTNSLDSHTARATSALSTSIENLALLEEGEHAGKALVMQSAVSPCDASPSLVCSALAVLQQPMQVLHTLKDMANIDLGVCIPMDLAVDAAHFVTDVQAKLRTGHYRSLVPHAGQVGMARIRKSVDSFKAGLAEAARSIEALRGIVVGIPRRFLAALRAADATADAIAQAVTDLVADLTNEVEEVIKDAKDAAVDRLRDILAAFAGDATSLITAGEHAVSKDVIILRAAFETAYEKVKNTASQCAVVGKALEEAAAGNLKHTKDTAVRAFDVTKTLALAFVEAVKKVGDVIKQLPLSGSLKTLPTRLPAFVTSAKKQLADVLKGLKVAFTTAKGQYQDLPFVGTKLKEAMNVVDNRMTQIVNALDGDSNDQGTLTAAKSLFKKAKDLVLDSTLVKGYFESSSEWLHSSLPDPKLLPGALRSVGAPLVLLQSAESSTAHVAHAQAMVLGEVDPEVKADPCVSSPSLQCIGRTALRFPMEVMELFKAVRNLDLMKCVPVEPAGDIAQDFLSKVKRILTDTFGYADAKLRTVTSQALKSAQETLQKNINSVIKVLARLRGMVTGFPEKVRRALIAMEPTAASMKGEALKLVNTYREEVTVLFAEAADEVVARTKELYASLLGAATATAADVASEMEGQVEAGRAAVEHTYAMLKALTEDQSNPCVAVVTRAAELVGSFKRIRRIAPVILDTTKVLVLSIVESLKGVGTALGDLPEQAQSKPIAKYVLSVVVAGKKAHSEIGGAFTTAAVSVAGIDGCGDFCTYTAALLGKVATKIKGLATLLRDAIAGDNEDLKAAWDVIAKLAASVEASLPALASGSATPLGVVKSAVLNSPYVADLFDAVASNAEGLKDRFLASPLDKLMVTIDDGLKVAPTAGAGAGVAAGAPDPCSGGGRSFQCLVTSAIQAPMMIVNTLHGLASTPWGQCIPLDSADFLAAVREVVPTASGTMLRRAVKTFKSGLTMAAKVLLQLADLLVGVPRRLLQALKDAEPSASSIKANVATLLDAVKQEAIETLKKGQNEAAAWFKRLRAIFDPSITNEDLQQIMKDEEDQGLAEMVQVLRAAFRASAHAASDALANPAAALTGCKPLLDVMGKALDGPLRILKLVSGDSNADLVADLITSFVSAVHTYAPLLRNGQVTPARVFKDIALQSPLGSRLTSFAHAVPERLKPEVEKIAHKFEAAATAYKDLPVIGPELQQAMNTAKSRVASAAAALGANSGSLLTQAQFVVMKAKNMLLDSAFVRKYFDAATDAMDKALPSTALVPDALKQLEAKVSLNAAAAVSFRLRQMLKRVEPTKNSVVSAVETLVTTVKEEVQTIVNDANAKATETLRHIVKVFKAATANVRNTANGITLDATGADAATDAVLLLRAVVATVADPATESSDECRAVISMASRAYADLSGLKDCADDMFKATRTLVDGVVEVAFNDLKDTTAAVVQAFETAPPTVESALGLADTLAGTVDSLRTKIAAAFEAASAAFSGRELVGKCGASASAMAAATKKAATAIAPKPVAPGHVGVFKATKGLVLKFVSALRGLGTETSKFANEFGPQDQPLTFTKVTEKLATFVLGMTSEVKKGLQGMEGAFQDASVAYGPVDESLGNAMQTAAEGVQTAIAAIPDVSASSDTLTPAESLVKTAKDLILQSSFVKRHFAAATAAVERTIPDPKLLPAAFQDAVGVPLAFAEQGSTTWSRTQARSQSQVRNHAETRALVAIGMGEGVDPCSLPNAVGLQCIGKSVMRYPNELAAVFQAVASLDFRMCVPSTVDSMKAFIADVGAKLESLSFSGSSAGRGGELAAQFKSAGDAVDQAKALVAKAISSFSMQIHDAIGTLGRLRSLISGLPERVRLALIRIKPNKESVLREMKALADGFVADVKALLAEAKQVAVQRLGTLWQMFSRTVTEAKDAANTATDVTLDDVGLVLRAVVLVSVDKPATPECGAVIDKVLKARDDMKNLYQCAGDMYGATEALAVDFSAAVKSLGGMVSDVTSAFQGGDLTVERVSTAILNMVSKFNNLRRQLDVAFTTAANAYAGLGARCGPVANTMALTAKASAALVGGRPMEVDDRGAGNGSVEPTGLKQLTTTVHQALMPLGGAAPGIFTSVKSLFEGLVNAIKALAKLYKGVKTMDFKNPDNQPANFVCSNGKKNDNTDYLGVEPPIDFLKLGKVVKNALLATPKVVELFDGSTAFLEEVLPTDLSGLVPDKLKQVIEEAESDPFGLDAETETAKLEELYKKVMGVTTVSKAVIRRARKNVADAIAAVREALSATEKAMQGLRATVVGLPKKVLEALREADITPDSFERHLKPLVDETQKEFEDAFEGATSATEAAYNKLKEMFGSAVATGSAAIKDGMKLLKGAFNEFETLAAADGGLTSAKLTMVAEGCGEAAWAEVLAAKDSAPTIVHAATSLPKAFKGTKELALKLVTELEAVGNKIKDQISEATAQQSDVTLEKVKEIVDSVKTEVMRQVETSLGKVADAFGEAGDEVKDFDDLIGSKLEVAEEAEEAEETTVGNSEVGDVDFLELMSGSRASIAAVVRARQRQLQKVQSDTTTAPAASADPCEGTLSFKCVGEAVLRIPLELGELFKKVRDIDFKACLPLDGDLVKIDNFLAGMRSSLEAEGQSVEVLNAVSLDSVRDLHRRFEGGVNDAIEAIIALRSIMVGFPPRVLEALLEPGDPVVAMTTLVDNVKAEIETAIYRTKELATRTVRQLQAMFATTTEAFKNRNATAATIESAKREAKGTAGLLLRAAFQTAMAQCGIPETFADIFNLGMKLKGLYHKFAAAKPSERRVKLTELTMDAKNAVVESRLIKRYFNQATEMLEASLPNPALLPTSMRIDSLTVQLSNNAANEDELLEVFKAVRTLDPLKCVPFNDATSLQTFLSNLHTKITSEGGGTGEIAQKILNAGSDATTVAGDALREAMKIFQDQFSTAVQTVSKLRKLVLELPEKVRQALVAMEPTRTSAKNKMTDVVSTFLNSASSALADAKSVAVERLGVLAKVFAKATAAVAGSVDDASATLSDVTLDDAGQVMRAAVLVAIENPGTPECGAVIEKIRGARDTFTNLYACSQDMYALKGEGEGGALGEVMDKLFGSNKNAVIQGFKIAGQLKREFDTYAPLLTSSTTPPAKAVKDVVLSSPYVNKYFAAVESAIDDHTSRVTSALTDTVANVVLIDEGRRHALENNARHLVRSTRAGTSADDGTLTPTADSSACASSPSLMCTAMAVLSQPMMVVQTIRDMTSIDIGVCFPVGEAPDFVAKAVASDLVEDIKSTIDAAKVTAESGLLKILQVFSETDIDLQNASEDVLILREAFRQGVSDAKSAASRCKVAGTALKEAAAGKLKNLRDSAANAFEATKTFGTSLVKNAILDSDLVRGYFATAAGALDDAIPNPKLIPAALTAVTSNAAGLDVFGSQALPSASRQFKEVVQAMQKLRAVVVGLPERVRLMLLRVEPTKASIVKEVRDLMHEVATEISDVLDDAKTKAVERLGVVYRTFASTADDAGAVIRTAAGAANAVPHLGNAMLFVRAVMLVAVENPASEECGAVVTKIVRARDNLKELYGCATSMFAQTQALVRAFRKSFKAVGDLAGTVASTFEGRDGAGTAVTAASVAKLGLTVVSALRKVRRTLIEGFVQSGKGFHGLSNTCGPAAKLMGNAADSAANFLQGKPASGPLGEIQKIIDEKVTPIVDLVQDMFEKTKNVMDDFVGTAKSAGKSIAAVVAVKPSEFDSHADANTALDDTTREIRQLVGSLDDAAGTYEVMSPDVARVVRVVSRGINKYVLPVVASPKIAINALSFGQVIIETLPDLVQKLAHKDINDMSLELPEDISNNLKLLPEKFLPLGQGIWAGSTAFDAVDAFFDAVADLLNSGDGEDEPCERNADCKQGFLCDKSRDKCKKDEDEGTACSVNSDCKSNDYACELQKCKRKPDEGEEDGLCARDADCTGANQECKNQRCKRKDEPECTDDHGCIGTKVCKNGVCKRDSDDDDASEDETTCENDRGCTGGKKCENGVCKKDPDDEDEEEDKLDCKPHGQERNGVCHCNEGWSAKSPDATTKWFYEKKFGEGDVFAGLHLSYDSIWQFAWDDDLPVVDALFFAGGAAYVSAWDNKFDIVSAYAKVAGYFDINKCINAAEGGSETDDEEGDDKEQQLLLAAQLKALWIVEEWDFEAQLCTIAPPCKTTHVTSNIHEFPLGEIEIFSFETTVMAGPLPVKFEVGAQMDFFVEFGIEAGGGRPEMTAEQEQQSGVDAASLPPLGKISGMIKPGSRVEVYGQVGLSIGIASVGGGIELTVLDIGLPTTAAYNFNSQKAGIATDLTVSALGGRLYVYAEFGVCPFCYEDDWTIFEWNGPAKTWNLFNEGLCKDCETQCVYGICDVATGDKCHCAPGWLGAHCSIGCPGKLQGKEICLGHGAQIENEDGVLVDDPLKGCRYDEASHTTSLHCEWEAASTTGSLQTEARCKRHQENHGVATEDHADMVCSEATIEEDCKRIRVCHGRGEGEMPTEQAIEQRQALKIELSDANEGSEWVYVAIVASRGSMTVFVESTDDDSWLRGQLRAHRRAPFKYIRPAAMREEGYPTSLLEIASGNGGISGGNGWIQVGRWRIGTYSFEGDNHGNTKHFVWSQCETRKTAQIFRYDGTVHPGPRNDYHLCDAALSGDGKPSGVVYGNGYIEFHGKWRLGNVDNTHMSIAHKDGKTAMIWRSDGTRHPGPRSDFTTWTTSTGGDIQKGDRFIQFGAGSAWRFADIDTAHSSIAYGGTTAVIYRRDGTIHPGPRTDYQASSRAVTGSLASLGNSAPVAGTKINALPVYDTLDIDELRIFTIPLTEADVMRQAHVLLGGGELGLELYFMFDEYEGGTFYDQASSGHAAKEINSGHIKATADVITGEVAKVTKWKEEEIARQGSGWGVSSDLPEWAPLEYHFAPPGSTSCDDGLPVSKARCQIAVDRINHQQDPSYARSDSSKDLVELHEPRFKNAACGNQQDFGDMPIGCSVRALETDKPYFKVDGSAANCNENNQYRLVCTGPGTPLKDIKGFKSWFQGKNAHPLGWRSSIGGFIGKTTGGTTAKKFNRGFGAHKDVDNLQGPASSKFQFGDITKGVWTLCAVTRYTGSTKGRILQTAVKNIFVGQYGGVVGVTHIEHWNTDFAGGNYHVDRAGFAQNEWLVSCSSNADNGIVFMNKKKLSGIGVGTTENNIEKIGVGNKGTTELTWGVNEGYAMNEPSDFAVAEVLTFNRKLEPDEFDKVADYLMNNILG